MSPLKTRVLRLLGLKRTPPKTAWGRMWRQTERVLTIFGLLYMGLHMFPQVVFAHSYSQSGTTVYSTSPLPPEIDVVLARADRLVEQSELAVPGRTERIFLCNSPWVYRLFNPRGGGFAISVPVTDCIFVRQADVAVDASYVDGEEFNTRSLSSVIAHEVTHGLIRNRLGVIASYRLPRWIDEGYSDYVSQEGSYPDEPGREMWAGGQNEDSPSFRYFGYRQMVSYLINDEQLTFDEIVQQERDRDAVEQASRDWLARELDVR